MKIYDSRKALISIHIPKCAGSSFQRILKSWFKRRFRRHYHDETQNKPPKKYTLYSSFLLKELQRDLCIHGHFNNNRGNGVRDYYPEAEQLITVIRDPFDVHLSNYFYVKREAQNQCRGAYRFGKRHPILENGWDLEGYLREAKKSYICQFFPPEITLDNYQQVLETQFLYIGIAEELQSSVNILAQKLNFPNRTVPHRNVSEWTESVPDGAREEFEENNRLEVLIYKYAKNNWGNNLEDTTVNAQQGASANPLTSPY